MGTEQFGRGNIWASIREIGVWKDVPFNPTNFRAVAPMTLGISQGASVILVNRYCMLGLGAALWTLNIAKFELTGSSGNEIQLLSPVKLAKQTYHIGVLFDGVSRVVRLQCVPAFGGNPPMVKVFTVPSSVFSLNNNCTFEATIPLDFGDSLL